MYMYMYMWLHRLHSQIRAFTTPSVGVVVLGPSEPG